MRELWALVLVLIVITACQTEDEVPPPETPAPVVYFPSCMEARNAGAAPLHTGDPGYRSGLDRDGDGIACDD